MDKVAMRPDTERSSDGPNWWIISVFTVAGIGFLVLAYFVSAYWQGVLVNGGTALLLFALFVFSEPTLVRHLRRPHTLNEALSQFKGLVTPLVQPATSGSEYIKDRVLRTIGKTGLHQDPPERSSTHFKNLDGRVAVEWRVEWDDKGLRHLVVADGRSIPRSLGTYLGWDKTITAHDERVYKILCYLLQILQPHA